MLAHAIWRHLEPGASIHTGIDDDFEMFGLADGIIEITSVLGRPDTPNLHFAHPVIWLGYGPIAAIARTPTLLARIPQATVKKAFSQHQEWWRHFIKPAIGNGDLALAAAADLLIRDNERRLAAVLLRLSGRRLAGPEDARPVDVPIMQMN